MDLLHPALMIRPDLIKIKAFHRSKDELIPTQEISLNEAGRIKSMLHMNLGWIACPPGEIPPYEIDRITEFKQDGSSDLEGETRDLKTKELLRREEYLFDFDKLRTTRLVIMDSGLSGKMVRESQYYYDENELLIKIETQISGDSNILSNSIIVLDKEENGLIGRKNIFEAKEDGELESISRTTYNYDSENRIKISITSSQDMVVTREYQYENKDYPQKLSQITEDKLSGVTRIIRNEFNDRGDRLRTTISTGDVRIITEYEYEYAT